MHYVHLYAWAVSFEEWCLIYEAFGQTCSKGTIQIRWNSAHCRAELLLHDFGKEDRSAGNKCSKGHESDTTLWRWRYITIALQQLNIIHRERVQRQSIRRVCCVSIIVLALSQFSQDFGFCPMDVPDIICQSKCVLSRDDSLSSFCWRGLGVARMIWKRSNMCKVQHFLSTDHTPTV